MVNIPIRKTLNKGISNALNVAGAVKRSATATAALTRNLARKAFGPGKTETFTRKVAPSTGVGVNFGKKKLPNPAGDSGKFGPDMDRIPNVYNKGKKWTSDGYMKLPK